MTMHTVDRMIELLTNVSKAGHGQALVALQDANSKTVRYAGKGEVGIASNGKRLLVICPGAAADDGTPSLIGVSHEKP